MLDASTIVTRIAALPSIPAYRPGRRFWLFAAVPAVLLLAVANLFYFAAPSELPQGPPPVEAPGRSPASPEPPPVLAPPADPALWIRVLSGASPPVAFAMVVSSFCLFLSTLILIVVLPIYLFSQNVERSRKAGGLVKTTLGFIVAAGGGVIGTLSFA